MLIAREMALDISDLEDAAEFSTSDEELASSVQAEHTVELFFGYILERCRLGVSALPYAGLGLKSLP